MSAFQASGLASGIDTQSMVSSLVELESRPLAQIAKRQSAFRARISTLADLTSKIRALEASAAKLSSGKVLASSVQSSTAGFTASATGSVQGSFQVRVLQLADVAKSRSAAFASSTAAVQAGTLSLSINGTTTNVALAEGTTLQGAADAINASGAAASAAIVFDGSSYYLQLTGRDPGHVVGQDPATALVLSESVGGAGQALGFSTVTTAKNARIDVDGLTIERSSNALTDAVPGLTLNLRAPTASAEALIVVRSPDVTASNVQGLLDSYNSIMRVLQKELAPVAGSTKTATSFAGDTSIQNLDKTLRSIITKQVTSSGSVRSLVDIGVKSDKKSGELTLDRTAFDKALASNPVALEALFSHASAGLGATTASVSKSFADATSGQLIAGQEGLNQRIAAFDKQKEKVEAHIEAFRTNLIRQFTAMEKVISGLNKVSTFLNTQLAQIGKKDD